MILLEELEKNPRKISYDERNFLVGSEYNSYLKNRICTEKYKRRVGFLNCLYDGKIEKAKEFLLKEIM